MERQGGGEWLTAANDKQLVTKCLEQLFVKLAVRPMIMKWNSEISTTKRKYVVLTEMESWVLESMSNGEYGISKVTWTPGALSKLWPKILEFLSDMK